MESRLPPWLLFFFLLAQLTNVINSQDDNYSLIINNTNYGDQQPQEQPIRGVPWMHLSPKTRALYLIASEAERMLNLELKAVEKFLLSRDKSRAPNLRSKRSTTDDLYTTNDGPRSLKDRVGEQLHRISLGRIHLEAKLRSLMDTLGEQNSTIDIGHRNSPIHREKLERIRNELLDVEREFDILQMQSKAQRPNEVIRHLVLKDLHATTLTARTMDVHRLNDVHFGQFVDKSVKIFPSAESHLTAASAAATPSTFSRISCLESTSLQSTLNGLAFPIDFALLNGANTFAATQTFHNVSMESLIVPKGMLDGVRPSNLLLVSGNQMVEGGTRFANDVTFRSNVEVHNGIIDGLDWNLLTSTAVRLNDVDGKLTIYGRKQFGRQGLKVLDEVSVANGRINGVDVVDMAENAMTVDGTQTLPSSRWNFIDVRLMRTLSATTVNGRKMPDDFVVLNRERIMDWKLNLTLPSLQTVSLDVRGRINGLDIAKDVMTKDGRQEIFGKKSFAVARMDNMAPLKDGLQQRRNQRASLEASRILVTGMVRPEIVCWMQEGRVLTTEDNLDTKRIIFDGQVTFANHLDLPVTSALANLVPIKDSLPVHLTSKRNIFHRVEFRAPAVVHGLIDGVDVDRLTHNAMLLSGNQTASGPAVQFNGPLTVSSAKLGFASIRGDDFSWTKTENAQDPRSASGLLSLIKSELKLRFVDVRKLSVEGRISDVDFSHFVADTVLSHVHSSDVVQTVTGRKTFNNGVTVLTANTMVRNRVLVDGRDFVRLLDESAVSGGEDFVIDGHVEFSGRLSVGNLCADYVNDVALKQLFTKSLLVDETRRFIINDILVVNNLKVDRLNDADVENSLVTSDDLRIFDKLVVKKLVCTGSVNGLRTQDLIHRGLENVVFSAPKSFEGTVRVSGDFDIDLEFRSLSSASLDKIVVHGNLDVTSSVDGLHWNTFKKDVIWIRPGESIRLSVPDLHFKQLHIGEVTELKGFLNDVHLPELLSSMVTLDGRQIDKGRLVFMRRVTVLGDLEVLGKVDGVQLKHLVTTNGPHLKKIDRKSFDSLEVRDLWVKGRLCGVSVADWRRRALDFVAGEPLDLDERPFDEIVEKCEGGGEPLRLDANLVFDKVPPIEANLDVDVNVIAAENAPPCRSLDSLKSTLRQIPLQLDEFVLQDTVSGRLLCTVHSPMDNRTVTVVSLKYLRPRHYAMLVETTRLFDRVTSTQLPNAVVGAVRSCHAFNPSSTDRNQLILVLDIAENSNFRILVWSPSSNKYISFEEQFQDLMVVLEGSSSWRVLLATQRRTKDDRQYSRVQTEVTVLTWSTHSDSFVERQSLRQPYPLVQARFVAFSKRLVVSSAVDRETSLVTLYKFDLFQATFSAIASMIERVDAATLVAGRHLNQTVLLFLTARGNLVTIVEARSMAKDKERSTLLTDRNVFVSKTAFRLFLLQFSWDRSLVAVVEEHFVTFFNYEGLIELGKMELSHVSNMFSLAAGDFNGDYLFLQTKGEDGCNFGTLSVYQRPNLDDGLEDCICHKDIVGLPATTKAPKMTPFDRLFCRGPDCHAAGSLPARPIDESGPFELHTEASKAGKLDKPAVDDSCDDQVGGATAAAELLHEEDIDEASTVSSLEETDMVFTEVASTDWILGDDVLAAFTSMSPIVGLQEGHQQDHQLSTSYDHDNDVERGDMATSTVSETFSKFDEDVLGPPSTMTILLERQEELGLLEGDAVSTQVADVDQATRILHHDWTTEQGVDSRHERFEFIPTSTESLDLRPDSLDMPVYTTEADSIPHQELDSIGLRSTVAVAETEERAFGKASTVLSADDVIYDADSDDVLHLSTPALVARFWKGKTFSGFPSTVSAVRLQEEEEESVDFASSAATEHRFKDVVMDDLSTVSIPDKRLQESESGIELSTVSIPDTRLQESETVELSTAEDSDEETESLYLTSTGPTERHRHRPDERFAEISTSLDRLIEPQDIHVEMSTMMDVRKKLHHDDLDNLLESSTRTSEQLPEEDIAEDWPSTPLSAERIAAAHEIVEISTVSRARLPEEQLDDFQMLMTTEAFEDGRLSDLTSAASTVSELSLASQEEQELSFVEFSTLKDIESIQDWADSAETSTLALQKLFPRGPHVIELSTASDAEKSEEEEFEVVGFSTVRFSSEVELNEEDIRGPSTMNAIRLALSDQDNAKFSTMDDEEDFDDLTDSYLSTVPQEKFAQHQVLLDSSTMSTDLIGKEDGYAVETSTVASLKQSGLDSLDSSSAQTIDSPRTSAEEYLQGPSSTVFQVEPRDHSAMSTIAFPVEEDDDELDDDALQATSTSSPHTDAFPRMNPTDQGPVDCRHRPDIDDQLGPLDLFTEASKADGSCDEQDVQDVTVVPVLIDDDDDVAAPTTTSSLHHGSEDEMTTNFVWPEDVERAAAAAASLFEASTLMAVAEEDAERGLFHHLSTVRDGAIDVSSKDLAVSTEVQESLQKIDDVQIPAASTMMTSFGLQEVESVESSDTDSSTKLTHQDDDLEIELRLSTVASMLDEDFKTVASTDSGLSDDVILVDSTIASADPSVQIDEDVLEASSARVGVDQLQVESDFFSTWRSIISRNTDEQERFDTTETMSGEIIGREKVSVEVSTARDDKDLDEEFVAETAAEASTDRTYDAKESFEARHDVSTIGGLDEKKDAEDFIESFSTALDIIDGPTPESIDGISTPSDDTLGMDSVRRPEPFSTLDSIAIDSQEFFEASTMGESRWRDVEDVLLEASTMSFRSNEEGRLELLDVSTVAETVRKESPIRPESSSTASLVEEDVVDEVSTRSYKVIQGRSEESPIWSTQRLRDQPDIGEVEWPSTEGSNYQEDIGEVKWPSTESSFYQEDFFQASTVSSEIRPSEIPERPFQFSSTAMPDMDDGLGEEDSSTLQAPQELVDRIQDELSTLGHPEFLEKDVRHESSTVRLSVDDQEDVFAEFSTGHQVREDDDDVNERTYSDASTSRDDVSSDIAQEFSTIRKDHQQDEDDEVEVKVEMSTAGIVGIEPFPEEQKASTILEVHLGFTDVSEEPEVLELSTRAAHLPDEPLPRSTITYLHVLEDDDDKEHFASSTMMTFVSEAEAGQAASTPSDVHRAEESLVELPATVVAVHQDCGEQRVVTTTNKSDDAKVDEVILVGDAAKGFKDDQEGLGVVTSRPLLVPEIQGAIDCNEKKRLCGIGDTAKLKSDDSKLEEKEKVGVQGCRHNEQLSGTLPTVEDDDETIRVLPDDNDDCDESSTDESITTPASMDELDPVDDDGELSTVVWTTAFDDDQEPTVKDEQRQSTVIVSTTDLYDDHPAGHDCGT